MKQAHIVDPMQAVKVRLAIMWRVHPDSVSDHRVRGWVAKQLAARGEEVMAWLDSRPT